MGIVFSFLFYNSNLNAVSSTGNASDKEITIQKGSSVRTIAILLENEHLIKNNLVFRIYCKINKKEKIIAGKYILNPSMSILQITDKLISGKVHIDTLRFTIPEGFEMRQIADKLSAEGIMTKEQFEKAVSAAAVEASYKYEFIKELPVRDNRLEGYLFPDTYDIYKNAAAEDVVGKMLGRFDTVYTETFRQRAKELDMTMDEVITLASIIEREAKHDDERKVISAVFHNRLKKKMMLQSCATIQYLLKERKEILTYKDLEIKSPYNTYKNIGLPPGPIASPGIKSIEAALYPENVDYLYFVAKNDGSHVFTRTYKEHINAQNKIKSNQ